jgi:hypothetical protein
MQHRSSRIANQPIEIQVFQFLPDTLNINLDSTTVERHLAGQAGNRSGRCLVTGQLIHPISKTRCWNLEFEGFIKFVHG